MADIVIYGGSFAAAAAAAKAAACAPNKSVVVIIPDPEPAFGSIGTIGGQNYFDIRRSGVYTKGSFSDFFAEQGQFYNTDTMANYLYTYVKSNRSNVTIYYSYDIKSFSAASSPYRITQVTICEIYRNSSSGYVVWGSKTETVTGKVFIDASDDGRLARIANSACTVGRYDWPAERLDPDERGSTGKARQQAATLMFKVRDVDHTVIDNDMTFVYDKDHGTYGCYGGSTTYQSNDKVISFNEAPASKGYAIKPINAAQNGKGSSEWWVNCLLVFNVDGRAYERDKNTSFYPTDIRSDYKTVDQAWANARKFLKNSSAFLTALKQFPGFGNVKLVLDSSGMPVVGSVLYLRETIHMACNSGLRGNGTEDTNYYLTATACNKAGAVKGSGDDAKNYATRIGLNFYTSDINAYQVGDMKDNGKYIWGVDVGKKLRPNMGVADRTPLNPVYVPYAALTTNYVANLLIPGYAAGIASFGWSECRVIPNLCVLGDAAGVAAAYAVNNGKQPGQLTATDISAIQKTLLSYGACLEKS